MNVKDADDQNPAFQHPRYAALLPRGGTQGQKLIVEPADLRAFDQGCNSMDSLVWPP